MTSLYLCIIILDKFGAIYANWINTHYTTTTIFLGRLDINKNWVYCHPLIWWVYLGKHNTKTQEKGFITHISHILRQHVLSSEIKFRSPWRSINMNVDLMLLCEIGEWPMILYSQQAVFHTGIFQYKIKSLKFICHIYIYRLFVYVNVYGIYWSNISQN